jgi:hypothetical protein
VAHLLNNLARVILFFSSYVPLAAIFFVLYIGKENLAAILALCAVVFGVVGLLWILHSSKSSAESTTRTIVEYRRDGSEVMGYIAAYLIPFVGFALDNLRQDLALAVFCAVLAYLYVNTDMLHINPTLHLFRYHVFEVTFESGIVQHLITKSDIARDDVIKVVHIDRNLWIEGVRS